MASALADCSWEAASLSDSVSSVSSDFAWEEEFSSFRLSEEDALPELLPLPEDPEEPDVLFEELLDELPEEDVLPDPLADPEELLSEEELSELELPEPASELLLDELPEELPEEELEELLLEEELSEPEPELLSDELPEEAEEELEELLSEELPEPGSSPPGVMTSGLLATLLPLYCSTA